MIRAGVDTQDDLGARKVESAGSARGSSQGVQSGKGASLTLEWHPRPRVNGAGDGSVTIDNGEVVNAHVVSTAGRFSCAGAGNGQCVPTRRQTTGREQQVLPNQRWCILRNGGGRSAIYGVISDSKIDRKRVV